MLLIASGVVSVLLGAASVYSWFVYDSCEPDCSLLPTLVLVTLTILSSGLFLGTVLWAAVSLAGEEIDAARQLLNERRGRRR